MMARLEQPKDRTKTEHVGIVDRVIWSDADRPAVIVALTDGLVATGPGLEEQFSGGAKIRFLGRWEDNPKYGPRFKFQTFVADVPASRKGQIDYLTTCAPNVGRSTAEKLCDAYGQDAVKVLREAPQRVAGDGIMSEINAAEAAAELVKLVALERTKIDLFELFKGRGFPGALVDAAIRAWGAKAPQAIRRNPYALLVRDLPGCGFKRCDRLYCDLGKRPDALKRQMLCGWSALKDAGDGHTWHAAETFVRALREAVPGDTDPRKAILLGLRAGWLRKRRDADGKLWLAEADKAIAEERVAGRVRALAAGPNLWPKDLPLSQADGDGLPSAHQRDTALQALASPVAILAGSPGTGKTFVSAFILREIIERFGADSIAAVAPTGKAAVRMSQSMQRLGLPIRATTIHRRLEIGRNGHDGQGWGFLRNRDNPLPQRVIVCDETSMDDTSLLADLLDATVAPVVLPAQPELRIAAGEPIPPRCRRCSRVLTDPESWKIGYGPECKRRVEPADYSPVAPETAAGEVVIPAAPAVVMPGTHVLLIGDPGQLSPVGHGAPLRDLIAFSQGGGRELDGTDARQGAPADQAEPAAGRQAADAGEVPAPPTGARVGYGELTEIRRNAGLIVRACRAIKDGQSFESAERIDLDAGRNLMLIETRDELHSLEVLDQVLRSMTKFDPVWQTQVLVPLNRKSALAREPVNDRLRGLLNPGPDVPMRPGDKVICLKNCRVDGFALDERRAEWGLPTNLPEHYQQVSADEFLANGETGRVLCADHVRAMVRFREDQPGDELVARVWLPKRKREQDALDDLAAGTAAQFDLAYAITGHKSQGSESPCVIILADPAATMVADRCWHYTAISRASKLCLIIGQRAVVEKQCARTGLVRRKTFLQELLREGAK